MFAQLKLYAAYIAGALFIALGLTATIEYGIIEHQKTTIGTLTNQLHDAQNANDAAQKTITDLTVERDKSAETCEARLSEKDTMIRKFQTIDDLKEDTHENTKAVDSGSIDNTLLGALNQLYSAPSDSKPGVCQATNTAGAGGTGILSGQVRYCFCSDNDVRNFLKNMALSDSDRQELRTILDGLR